MVGGEDFCLRHALGFASDLWRMCVINGQPAKVAAAQLQLDFQQVAGAVRLLKSCRLPPSPERLACVVMRDHGLDDEDVAEMFGRSRRWATLVREQAKAIRAAEPIAHHLEFLDEHLYPGVPTPGEIRQRAEAVRSSWSIERLGRPDRVEIKAYIYGNAAFTNLPISA